LGALLDAEEMDERINVRNGFNYIKQQISDQDHSISSDFNVFQKSKNTNRLIWFGFDPIKVG
jgi:hypothetical protein